MLVLAIDTAATQAAACVHDAGAGRELGRAVEFMRTGHAERLMAVIAAALQAAGTAFADLDRIAVSIGPGSFTGVRVGVAAARGLALALNVPAVGVSTLEALAAAASIRSDAPDPVMAVLEGGRETLFAAVFAADGTVLKEPAAIGLDAAVAWASALRPTLVGTAADQVGDAVAGSALPRGSREATADIAAFARLGARKPAGGKPAPLYLRAPDAKPQAGFILPRQG